MILDKHLRAKKADLEQYDVEKIVDERKDGNRMLYLVKWVGYPHQENTWEPRVHLKNAPEKIRQWNRQKKKLNRSTASVLLCQKLSESNTKHTVNNKKDHSKPISKLRTSYQSSQRLSRRIDNDFIFQKHQIKANTSHRIENSQAIDPHTSTKSMRLRARRLYQERSFANRQKQLSHSTEPETQMAFGLNKNAQQAANQQGQSSQPKREGEASQISQAINRARTFNSKVKNFEEDVFICQQSISESNYEKAEEDSVYIYLKRERQQKDIETKRGQEEEAAEETKNKQPSRHQTLGTRPDRNQIRFVVQSEQSNEFPEYSQAEEPLPELRPSHDHFFEESPQQGSMVLRELEYSHLSQIMKMFKQQGRVLCSVLTKSGLEFNKVPFETLEQMRPDLVVAFFNGKFPCKSID